MDILDITDVNKLKVLAYDQLALLQQVQRNLDIINTRIAELQQLQGELGAEHGQRIAAKSPAATGAHFGQMPNTHVGQPPQANQPKLGPFTGRSHY